MHLITYRTKEGPDACYLPNTDRFLGHDEDLHLKHDEHESEITPQNKLPQRGEKYVK